jgi:hypothetical protein
VYVVTHKALTVVSLHNTQILLALLLLLLPLFAPLLSIVTCQTVQHLLVATAAVFDAVYCHIPRTAVVATLVVVALVVLSVLHELFRETLIKSWWYIDS